MDADLNEVIAFLCVVRIGTQDKGNPRGCNFLRCFDVPAGSEIACPCWCARLDAVSPPAVVACLDAGAPACCYRCVRQRRCLLAVSARSVAGVGVVCW